MSRPDGGTRVAVAALLRAAERGEPCGGPHLLVHDPGRDPRRVELGSDLTVGRGDGAALRLRDEGVSRLHARFRVDPDGGATVEDLGSKNGVRWNGRPIGGSPCRLRPGDAVVLGTTTLVYADPLAGPAGEDGPAEAVAAASTLQAPGDLAAAPPRSTPFPAPGALLAAGAALLALAGALLAAG